ncbi:hypothetical protein HG537_0A07370 [Torulaspora globosa]|uniref:Amino-acid acetyltransferase, mitochondrial n=1 Tax=Torulaspora globosa TaxID=48254 RepID=A0A7H9HMD3_9SACH|nr:hypothetical protein HG537_0A07370 [Torulaspora sp. CBS 2947]
MWKQLIGTGFRYDQPNAAAKKLILSVLNSTATKREAKDYLKKYASDSKKINHCLLMIRGLKSVDSRVLVRLSGTVKKLRMLGLRPIFIIPPSSHVTWDLETLDQLVTRSDLRPIHLQNALFRSVDGSYSSLLCSQSRVFDSDELNLIPIIQPNVVDEATSTVKCTDNVVEFVKNILPKGGLPYIDKFFILNTVGGIPSDERRNNAHVFINLSQEYGQLARELAGKVAAISRREPDSEGLLDRLALHLKENELKSLEKRYEEHLEDLKLMDVVLSGLSNKSTGLITTIGAASLTSDRKNPLLYNLLTDRSLISSSLPRFKNNSSYDDHCWYEISNESQQGDDVGTGERNQEDAVLVTTVVKKGVHIKTFSYDTLTQFNSVGLPNKFYKNIEPGDHHCDETLKVNVTKLKQILDQSFGRSLDLEHYLNRINGRIASIIVIGDYEGIAILTHEGPQDNSFVYLDKFAVLPHLKGSLGISDIIFNLMFKYFPKELLWRSRSDNVVNKWYFQRSVGVLDLSIDLSNGNRKKSQFKLFYHGDPGANEDPFQNKDRLIEYATYIRDISPSWAK